MTAKKRRRKMPNFAEWGTLATRAVLIVVDWLINGHGPR